MYLELYLLAGRCDAGGALQSENKNYQVKDIAWILRQDEGITASAISELRSADLIHEEKGILIISRFMDEQGPGALDKRDYWAEKQRVHRERIKTEDIKTKSKSKSKRSQGQSLTLLTMSMTANDIQEKEKPPTHTQPQKIGSIPKDIIEPMIDAIAEVTLKDKSLNYPRLAAEAKKLLNAGYTAEQILENYREGGKWFMDDWRGKKGQYPEIGNIRESIKSLIDGRTTASATNKNFAVIDNWSQK